MDSKNSGRAGQDGKPVRRLIRDLLKGLMGETVFFLKWALCAAVLGAMIAGGAGLWLFGTTGFAYGAVGGAIAGGIIGIVIYYQFNSI